MAVRVGVLLSAGAVLAATATPVQAYSESVAGSGNSVPWMQFNKNPSSPLNSSLTAWVSVGGTRYRISQRAGSGNGNTNDCTSNQGWLPNGFYDPDDSDTGSTMKHYNKTWGSTVVRGWVWELGAKTCSTGARKRTELFIHSQGTSGWSNSNYASQGCIKINQTDRAHLHNRWNAAYSKAKGFLQVVS